MKGNSKIEAPILLLVCAGLAFAGPALASGIDMSIGSSTGSPGAQSNYGYLECAGGQDFEVVLTFEPAEDISDLVAAEWILDARTSNDIHSTGNFWDWENTNASAFNLSRTIPSPRCVGFKPHVWSMLNAGDAWAAAVIANNRVRMTGTVYRPTELAVTANQKLFLVRMVFHTDATIEAGGGLAGCCEAYTTLEFLQVTPTSAHSNPVTALNSAGVGYTSLYLTPEGSCAGPVGARRKTWGALKSLYR